MKSEIHLLRHERSQLAATRRAVLLLAWFPALQLLAAPPKVDHFFPSGGQRGTTVELTLTGSFDTWPIEVWTDRDGLAITAEETKGKLKIAIADTAAGTYWLRVHNRDGAAALRPFVVGNLSEVVEAEPNDDPQHPQVLKESCIVNGKLEKAGDVDGFAVRLSQGETFVASLTANRVLGSPMDAVMQICDPSGFVLAQNDDDGSLDPHLVFKVPADGSYLIRAFAFPETPNSTINFAGASNFIYRLTVTRRGFVEYCLPMSLQRGKSTNVTLAGWNIPADGTTVVIHGSADDLPAFANHSSVCAAFELPITNAPPFVAQFDSGDSAAQAVALPCAISGVLSAPAEVHLFSFQASKGQMINLEVLSRSLGFPMDAVMTISDANGDLIKEIDDHAKQCDPQYTFTVPKDGAYQVSIGDLHDRGGKRFAYRLEIAVAEPSFTLSVASDVFQVAPNNEVEIPITITRQNGLNQDIEITAVDLPTGLSAAPVISQASGETAKSVTLKLKATDAPRSGRFFVLGRVADPPRFARATFTQAAPAHTSADLWLHTISAENAK